MTALLKVPQLTKYELLEEIGHGGMATVYRARDRRLEREVAVKIIHRHLRDSSDVAARFVREATAVAKLRHPNIVEVFDVSDPEESERYLVVELVRGITLREQLKTGGPLVPEVAAAVALEVGAGLDHAHRQGVIHRDVKPENVLIELSPGTEETERPAPRVKLTDFGIAKLLDSQGVTSTGQVLGSPAHMAPEQIDGGDVDARTDVFALGVLLYEAMVGRLPFQGDHPAQVLRKVLDGDFTLPDRLDARIGAGYSRIVARALARDREQRFASIEAMLVALRQELASLGFTKLPPLLEALRHPDPQFEDDIVPRLVERGARGRGDGNVAMATECFGRALAYKPGDQVLLRRVSGLERTRMLKRAGGWMSGGLALAAVIWGFTQRQASSPVEARMSPVGAAAQKPPEPVKPPVPPAEAVDVPPPTAAGSEGEENEQTEPEPTAAAPAEPVKARPAPPRRSAAVEPAPAAPALRDVVVRITGAMGGTLKIDGETLPWFGDVRHSLSVGPHQFEFVAPDNTCCQSSARTVTVVAGEGPQQVIGEIPFLDATLRVVAEPGELGHLTCPTLFPGDLRFPGARNVSMSHVRVTGICTLRSDAAGSLPKKTEVTLRAGQTQVIQWP